MATKEKRPFQIILDDVPNPQDYSKAGALVERAGMFEGAAAETSAKATAQLGTSLFNVGVAAGTQYAKGQVTKDTKDTLARFEDSPENTRGRDASETMFAYDQRVGQQEEDITRPDPVSDPSVDALRAEAHKYREAEQQGLLTKDEVLTRISSSVKKWSARMPGLQGEFRKAAANETGVSNIDVYQIHQALTTQSAKEKAALQRQKFMEDYVKQVADYHGKPITSVTNNDVERFYAFKQLETQQKSLEAAGKVASITQEQQSRLLDQKIGIEHSRNLVRMSSLFNDWEQANQDTSPAGAKKRDEISSQLSGMLGGMRVQLGGYIRREFTNAGIDAVETKKRVDLHNAEYDNLDKMLKTKEGFDVMRQLIGRNKDTASDMEARFKMAFPALEAWGRTGVAADLMKLSLDPSGHKTLERLLGKDGAAKWISQPQRMIAFEAQMLDRMFNPATNSNHGQLDLRGPEVAAYTPEAQQVALDMAIAKLTLLPEKTNVEPKDIVEFGEMAHVAANSVAPTTTATTARFNAVMDIPATLNQIVSIPAAKRQQIAAPIHNRLVAPTRLDISETHRLVEEYNTIPDTKSGKLSIGQDATGKLVVVKERGADVGSVELRRVTPTFSLPHIVHESQVAESTEATLARSRIQEKLNRVNVNLKAIGTANYISTLSDDNSFYKMGEMVVNGMRTGAPIGALSPAEAAAKEEGPARRTPDEQARRAPIDNDHVAFSIIDSEGGWLPRGQIDSGKGTLGRYQLTEGAVKDVLGKSYDAKKLNEYRTDEAQAKAIAVKYWKKMLGEFGDPLMAAAAYNWGPTAFKKHLATVKAEKKTWLEGLPPETLRYVNTFRNSYSTYFPGERDLATGAKNKAPRRVAVD